MWEYGNLKCVLIDDETGSWFLEHEEKGEYKETELGNVPMVLALNRLGENGWELFSIDAHVGYVLKRKL